MRNSTDEDAEIDGKADEEGVKGDEALPKGIQLDGETDELGALPEWLKSMLSEEKLKLCGVEAQSKLGSNCTVVSMRAKPGSLGDNAGKHISHFVSQSH
jgi:hypothetical protein